MKLYSYFDKEKLLKIAKGSGNKQIVKDVNYASFLVYHGGKLYCEWIDEGAFIIGQHQRSAFRIIGLCTKLECRGKGLAKYLLRRAEDAARENEKKLIKTISLSGVDFYVKQGYDVKGIKHGDYILEKEL